MIYCRVQLIREKRAASALISIFSIMLDSDFKMRCDFKMAQSLKKYSALWLQLVKLKIRFLARCFSASSMLLNCCRKIQNYWYSIKNLSKRVQKNIQNVSWLNSWQNSVVENKILKTIKLRNVRKRHISRRDVIKLLKNHIVIKFHKIKTYSNLKLFWGLFDC